jgi:hypothetical protein
VLNYLNVHIVVMSLSIGSMCTIVKEVNSCLVICFYFYWYIIDHTVMFSVTFFWNSCVLSVVRHVLSNSTRNKLILSIGIF